MADAGYLTIGKVVKRLKDQFPDLSVSKVRYLEDEGLLDPSRTPGGYRLYSAKDVKRLETILYLQKTRFLPLSVIKDELDSADAGAPSSHPLVADADIPNLDVDDPEMVEKMHPIERMPEIAGVSVSFARQLSEAGIITLHRSPQGRDLIDGRDLSIIHAADALRRYGLEPRNLRQYVAAANRESAMFEQALSVYTHKRGESSDVARDQMRSAFDTMAALTNAIRLSLIKRSLRDSLSGLED